MLNTTERSPNKLIKTNHSLTHTSAHEYDTDNTTQRQGFPASTVDLTAACHHTTQREICTSTVRLPFPDWCQQFNLTKCYTPKYQNINKQTWLLRYHLISENVKLYYYIFFIFSLLFFFCSTSILKERWVYLDFLSSFRLAGDTFYTKYYNLR